jgi:hypothetical protein
VVGADVALESLMLPEGLAARWVSSAPESLVALVCLLVSLKTGRREETFVALLPIAMI